MTYETFFDHLAIHLQPMAYRAQGIAVTYFGFLVLACIAGIVFDIWRSDTSGTFNITELIGRKILILGVVSAILSDYLPVYQIIATGQQYGLDLARLGDYPDTGPGAMVHTATQAYATMADKFTAGGFLDMLTQPMQTAILVMSTLLLVLGMGLCAVRIAFIFAKGILYQTFGYIGLALGACEGTATYADKTLSAMVSSALSILVTTALSGMAQSIFLGVLARLALMRNPIVDTLEQLFLVIACLVVVWVGGSLFNGWELQVFSKAHKP